MPTLRKLLSPLVPFVLCAWAPAQGRIVVAHDEWTLTNQAFVSAPDTGEFVLNVADWFSGSQPGSFRAWSNNAAYTGSSLAQTMTGAGHTWSVSTTGTFDLATLSQYDGVFLGGYFAGIDAGVLTQYVQAGGNVYVCGGIGGGSMAANTFNPFLAGFGLSFAAGYNGFNGLQPTASAHPIFAGVPGLFAANGNSVALTMNPPAGAAVLVTASGQGMYAVYDAYAVPTIHCTAKTNSQGCTPAISWSGTPSASGATPFAIGASQVINKTVGILIYGHQSAAIPFQGGTLCIGGQVKRCPGQGSGGSAVGTDCTGSFNLDFSAFAAGGSDPLLVAGQAVHAQYWSRDVASSFGASLTNSLGFSLKP